MTTMEPLTRAELYREACRPAATIDKHFVQSLIWQILKDEDLVPMSNGNMRSDERSLALRATIGEAWDEYRTAETRKKLTNEQHIWFAAESTRVMAMKVIKLIARNLYRECVPERERTR